jgi:hypothetical protein
LGQQFENALALLHRKSQSLSSKKRRWPLSLPIERPRAGRGLRPQSSDADANNAPGARGYARESSESPILNAFCRVAPSDRFNFLAILAAGVFFFAIVFSSRICTDVQARLFVPFFMRIKSPCMSAGACNWKLVKRKDQLREVESGGSSMGKSLSCRRSRKTSAKLDPVESGLLKSLAHPGGNVTVQDATCGGFHLTTRAADAI